MFFSLKSERFEARFRNLDGSIPFEKINKRCAVTFFATRLRLRDNRYWKRSGHARSPETRRPTFLVSRSIISKTKPRTNKLRSMLSIHFLLQNRSRSSRIPYLEPFRTKHRWNETFLFVLRTIAFGGCRSFDIGNNRSKFTDLSDSNQFEHHASIESNFSRNWTRHGTF